MEVKQNSQRRAILQLTIQEAADYLGVRPSTIRQWVWRRRIDVVRIGRCVRIPQEACDRIIERGTMPALEPR
jgi:excisionase family DNA binding protein